MRAFIAALLIAALIPACAQAKSVTPAKTTTPRVLILDRAQIWARYVDPKATDADANKARVDLAQAMRPLVRKFMDQAGATLVIDKAVVLAGGESAEIDPQSIISDLDKTHTPLLASAPSSTMPAPKAIKFRALIINSDDVPKTTPADPDAGNRFHAALKQLMTDTTATLVLSGDAILIYRKIFDASADVRDRVNGGNGKITHPIGLPRILTLDRDKLLTGSKVGKSITAQLEDFTRRARTEFDPTADALHAEGDALGNKLSTLAPEEQKREVDAFNARQAEFQAAIDARQKIADDAFTVARESLDKKLLPLMSAEMATHDADLLISSEVVVQGPEGADVTNEATKDLDDTITSVQVPFPQAASQP